MVRYNALYYPVISLAAILFSRHSLRLKTVAMSAIIMLLGGFMLFNLQEYRRITGTSQFSAFEGWQMAANALYGYSQTQSPPEPNVPSPFRDLHLMVRQHRDSIERLTQRPDIDPALYYLWDEGSPLKQYLRARWGKDTVTDGFKKWASMGPLYGPYGNWLIRQHLLIYARYYLWPNLINYYAPRAEFMASYNMGKDSVERSAMLWFHLQNAKTRASSKRIPFAEFYPHIMAIINPLFIITLLTFWVSRGYKRTPREFSRSLRWIALIWIVNLVFSVLAAPIVLRYQIFPVIITLTFLGLLMEFVLKYLILEKSPSLPYHSIVNS
jgi:hypothetical protein